MIRARAEFSAPKVSKFLVGSSTAQVGTGVLHFESLPRPGIEPGANHCHLQEPVCCHSFEQFVGLRDSLNLHESVELFVVRKHTLKRNVAWREFPFPATRSR